MWVWAVFVASHVGVALVVPTGGTRRGRVEMIISPEAMITVQKTFNRAGFEKTVTSYMKTKKVSREVAEREFATYLLDPDAYVLAKAENSFREKSPTKQLNVKPAEPGARRSPLLQAYIDEGGDEVRERIEKFERQSSIKALSIISVLSALLLGKDYIADILP